jgi:hypothetical protein
VRVGGDAGTGRDRVADPDHGAPLGEARAQPAIVAEPLAQAVEPFGDLFARMAGQRLGTGIDLDARNDPGLHERLREGQPLVRLLAQRLVVEDRAADAFAQARCRHDQVAIRATRFGRQRDAERGESLVGGGSALVHRQQAPVTGDQRRRRVDQRLGVHVGPSLPVSPREANASRLIGSLRRPAACSSCGWRRAGRSTIS